MKILITGGAGYIGSHMLVKTLIHGHDVVVVDNLSNSNLKNIHNIQSKISKPFHFIEDTILNDGAMDEIFNEFNFDAVLHFAGLKSITESFAKKEHYFENNVQGSNILRVLAKKYNVNKFIFSSSANVYGTVNRSPIKETDNLNPESPYGKTKQHFENDLISDPYFANQKECYILRYFNPVGSWLKYSIGEVVDSTKSNIFPMIVNSLRNNEPFKIFGTDYKTKDGTAIRDYIHIIDLIEAHYACLESDKKGINIYNVGTGIGYTVNEVLNTYKEVNNVDMMIEKASKRQGDASEVYASNKRICEDLKWTPKYDLAQMCYDVHKFSFHSM
ncbi:UDP-glucose 4-epimerase [beta proteobacterium KB13]|uniref:UDP-glucose 4-epimerase n=1 Tax=beta proteobacterium KB13 TaxID=314607 RepID=B6BTK9_9PROT|nr:UDP-glucose 4-epimerase [beta proteobacterium KB13]